MDMSPSRQDFSVLLKAEPGDLRADWIWAKIKGNSVSPLVAWRDFFMLLRLGTRGSALARWQAEWVAARLKELGVGVELTPITTRGDRQDGPIPTIGGEGIFVKEIERQLLEGRIDLGVHSLKDLPTALPAELSLAAAPERAPAGDVLVCREFASIEQLPHGAVIGTSSVRRRAQLLHVRPDLVIRDIRGNVDTRLRKLDGGEYDAMVLAEAGLQRLGLADRVTQRLPFSVCLPAAGQGALALEIRADDEETRHVISPLDHAATHAAVAAERAMLAALQGGCLAPIAGYAQIENDRLTLTGRVISRDGGRLLESTMADLSGVDIAAPAGADAAEALGRRVADALLAQGAAELIHAARQM
jgi:hydroxymethylbilane synthase